MNTHIRYNTGRRERKNEETALTDKTFPLSERESMKKLYEEITAHIRSRFTDTKRDYEITERSVGRGLYGVQLETHTAYGASRVVAGHFPMMCFYEDGIYDAELRTGSKKGMATVRKGKTCYSPSAGETKTLQLIAVASDYGEEPLIADIMIVAACKSILHWHTWEKWEHLVHSLSEQAEEVLREKGYELWHASTKYFVFQIIDIKDNYEKWENFRDCLADKSPDARKIADAVWSVFSSITDDGDTCCEVLLYGPASTKVFLYEHMAGRFLENVRKDYEDSKATDVCPDFIRKTVDDLIKDKGADRTAEKVFAFNVHHFKTVLRPFLAERYKGNPFASELETAADARIDGMLSSLEAMLPPDGEKLAAEFGRQIEVAQKERLQREKEMGHRWMEESIKRPYMF